MLCRRCVRSLPLPIRVRHAFVVIATLAGCGGTVAPEDPCGQAAAHLAACAGAPEASVVPAGASCDREAARSILGSDCATLGAALGDAKADTSGWLARFACAAGLLSACPVRACTSTVQPAPGAACVAWADTQGCEVCAYYRCREAAQPCGPDGYVASYVGPYCQRFASVTEPRVSQAARRWLQRVRQCLVRELDRRAPIGTACEETRAIGLETHVTCYLETGFCALSPFDWLAIVRSIDPGDVPLRTALVTAQGCLESWLGP